MNGREGDWLDQWLDEFLEATPPGWPFDEQTKSVEDAA
jgi:hypothetical protein